MEINLTEIIVSVIGLISLILTSVIVPLIKAKVSREEWDTLMIYTEAAVKAAEIIFGSGKGKEKFEWVSNYIQQECAARKLKVDMQNIQIAIENTWEQLENSRKEK